MFFLRSVQIVIPGSHPASTRGRVRGMTGGMVLEVNLPQMWESMPRPHSHNKHATSLATLVGSLEPRLSPLPNIGLTPWICILTHSNVAANTLRRPLHVGNNNLKGNSGSERDMTTEKSRNESHEVRAVQRKGFPASVTSSQARSCRISSTRGNGEPLGA